MTEKIQIFSGPTGDLIYDSQHGTEVNDYDAVVDDAYGEGIILHTDQSSGSVLGYFNATRNAPEQFMARYETDHFEGDLLSKFKNHLEDELDELGWPILTDAGGKQEFFNHLCDLPAVEPSPSVDRLGELVSQSDKTNSLHFGVPDRRTAAQLVAHLQSLDEAPEIVVTEAYVPDALDDNVVKIFIGKSQDGVVPIRETKEVLELDSLRRSVKDVQEAGSTMLSTSASSDVDASTEEIIRALKEAEIESVGITPKSPYVNGSNNSIVSWGVTTALLGTIVAALLIVTLSLSSLREVLVTEFSLQLPYLGVSIGTVPSWQILVLPMAVAIGFGGWRFLRWLRDGLRPEVQKPLNNRLLNDARDLVSELHSLKNETAVNSEIDFKQRAEEAFEPFDYIQLVLAKSEQRATRIKIGIGVGVGLLVAAAVGAMLWGARPIIFENWQAFIEIALVLSLAGVLGGVIAGIISVLRRLLRRSQTLRIKKPQQRDGHDKSATEGSPTLDQYSGEETNEGDNGNNQQEIRQVQQRKTNDPHSCSSAPRKTRGPRNKHQKSNQAEQAVKEKRLKTRAARRRSSGSRQFIILLLLIFIFIVALLAVFLML